VLPQREIPHLTHRAFAGARGGGRIVVCLVCLPTAYMAAPGTEVGSSHAYEAGLAPALTKQMGDGCRYGSHRLAPFLGFNHHSFADTSPSDLEGSFYASANDAATLAQYLAAWFTVRRTSHGSTSPRIHLPPSMSSR
jgi:hypothetical protein